MSSRITICFKDQIPAAEDNNSLGGKIYTNEEIAKQFGFKGDLAKWFCNREFNPEDPVVVLEYLPRFSNVHHANFAENKAEIIRGLRDNGAIPEDEYGRVFYFPKYPDMHAAHDAMKQSHAWAFHTISHRIANQITNVPDQCMPKLTTTVIESFNTQECIVRDYQFFQQ